MDIHNIYSVYMNKDKHKQPGKLIRFPEAMNDEIEKAAAINNITASHLIISGTRMALEELKKERPNLPLPK